MEVRGLLIAAPVLEKAPDFFKNLARASIPLFEPKITGREIYLNAFLRIWQCSLYLGHSVRM
jgi:hypothetical protein